MQTKETVEAVTQRTDDVDMPDELDLDWSQAKPNPYAGQVRHSVSVHLDPDLAEVITTAEAVNKTLRASIEAMPAPDTEKKAA